MGAFSQSQHRLAQLTSSTLDTLHQHSQLQSSVEEETDFVDTYGIWQASDASRGIYPSFDFCEQLQEAVTSHDDRTPAPP